MKRSLRTFAVAAALLMGASVCMAEQIDNPQYKNWAKFKPGTTVTTKTVSDMGGNKTEMETTTTLVDVAPDKLTLEAKTSMVMQGNKMDMPANKTEVQAKIEKPAATAPAADAPKATTSTEDADAAGTKVKCTVTTMTTTTNGMTINAKTWTSDEVPGMIVKSESTMDGAMKGTTNITLTAMTKK